MEAPCPPCRRGRAITAAAVTTAVLIVLVIVGAFFLGLWKVKTAIDGGALTCDMLVPFTGVAHPVPPFAPGEGSASAPYRPHLALSMVQFVSAAYGAVCGNPPPERHTTSDGEIWHRVATFTGVAAPSIGGGAEEAYGYAWLNTDPLRRQTLVFAFRGTLSLAGWIADFNFPQQPSVVFGPTANVHRGFENLYLTLRDAVRQTATQYPHARLLITGHSLGAALATFAAGDPAVRERPEASLVELDGVNTPYRETTTYTYGCPRIGDIGFVRALETAAPDNWRIINRADAIPTVPPPGIGGYAYRHTPRHHTVLSQQKGIASNHSLTGAYYRALAAGQ